MLSVSTYNKEFVAACRGRIERQLAAYQALAAAAPGAAAAFEADYFVSMLLALDHSFMHRGRGQEGKDGNPLNEVRMLSVAILDNDGVLKKDSQIKYDAKTSVAGIAIGEPVVLTRETFGALAAAFCDEIGKRFP